MTQQPFKPGDLIVSRACGMTLYGRVEQAREDGRLNITRLWRTRRHRDRPSAPWQTPSLYERQTEAADWHRDQSECQLYRDRRALYDANGKKIMPPPPASDTRTADQTDPQHLQPSPR